MATALSSAITYARQLCHTDSNGITDTLGITFGNDGLQDFTRALIDRDVNAAQLTEAYATLTPSDSPPGKFAWPGDMFALKTVEIDWTGTGGQNFQQGNQVDISNIQFVSFDYLRKNQPTTVPLFTNWGDTGEIFPTPLVNVTVRIIYFKSPTEYVATTDAIAYPLSLDYRALSCKISNLYETSLEKSGLSMSRGKVFATGQAALFDRMYQERVDKIIGILAPASKQPIQPTPLQVSGWNY